MILIKLHEIFFTSPVRRDKIVLANLVLSVLMNILLWLFLTVIFWQASDFIVLRYNIYFGISLFGPWWQILSVPLTSLLFILINFSAAFYFYLNYRALSYFLSFAATATGLILLVAGLFLIYINV